jgi:hypothetical protein
MGRGVMMFPVIQSYLKTVSVTILKSGNPDNWLFAAETTDATSPE